MKTAMTTPRTLWLLRSSCQRWPRRVTAAQSATAAIIARRIRADTMRVASKNDGADADTEPVGRRLVRFDGLTDSRSGLFLGSARYGTTPRRHRCGRVASSRPTGPKKPQLGDN